MKKVFLIFAATLLLMTAACAEEAPSPPVFSVSGGVYAEAVTLELSGQGAIYYTTDGSAPTTASPLYTEPIVIGPSYSQVQTGWREPPAQMPSGTVIRAAVISGFQSSATVSQTYFIGQDTADFFGGVPMVDLALSPSDLWDPENGIYSNFEYEHKVPATFQYYTDGGVCDINRAVEVKVSGHGSRANPKKSLRVYFKNTDPAQGKYLDYPLIPGNLDRQGGEISRYSKVTFRISDYNYTDLRDVVAQRLGEQMRPDTAASVPMALFLNGEYWGLYECREQYDDDYVAAHYGIDHDDVVFLDRDWTLEPQYEALSDTGTVYTDKLEYSSGPEDGNDKGLLGQSYYLDQWRYVKSLVLEKDFTDPAVYAEFCANVDIDSFIDYMILYVYSGNDDWPGNNFKLWRVAEEKTDPSKYGADGKWRFMIHDFDIAFEDIRHETLWLSAFGSEPDTEARHPAYATAFIAGLLKNPDFRNEFAQRTRMYLSSVLSEGSMRAVVDSLVAAHKDGKTADLLRWGWGPVQQRPDIWLWNMEGFADYAAQRPQFMISQYADVLNSQFSAGITGQARIMLRSAPAGLPETRFTVCGADAGTGGGRIYPLFAGIPVTVKAEAADGTPLTVTVSHRGDVSSGEGEITFTPLPNEPYTVTAAVTANGQAAAPAAVGLLRADRFSKMAVGEALPAVVFDFDGSRLAPELTLSGDCASLDGNIVRAVSPGRAVLTASCGGQTYSATVVVN